MMVTATGQGRRPDHRRPVGHWRSKVFAVDPAGIHWARGVLVLDVLLVALLVFWSIGHEDYLVSAVFGVLFTAVVDPGGHQRSRVSALAVFGLVGAAVTALGFGIGGVAWGWLVLAAFAVTLLASLTIAFGAHRAVAALLLNIQFIIALAVGVSYLHIHVATSTWGQALAWVGGCALWIAATSIGWLVRGRQDAPALVPELPADTTRHPLTPPVIAFAVIRAVVIGGTTALAYGLDLSHGQWLSIAAIIAMKPSAQEAVVIALQRLAGALMGAVAAGLLLLIPAAEHGQQLVSITYGLEVVALIFFLHAGAIRFWNYAFYTGAIAAGVLLLLDLPQPSDYSAEGLRVLWTLCGVGIGVLVMLLAGLLSRSPAKPTSQPD